MKYVEGLYEIKLCYCIKKQDPKRKIGFSIFYLPYFSLKKFLDPFISQNKNSSDYRLHGTQNNQIELTVSMQKLVLKNMHQVQIYLSEYANIQGAKPNLHILRHFFQRWRLTQRVAHTFVTLDVKVSISTSSPQSLKCSKKFLCFFYGRYF